MAADNESVSIFARRALEDLKAIQESLLDACDETGADPVAYSRRYLDLELAAELKALVDGIRRLLWAYIQTLSAKSGRPLEEVLNWYKMEIATDMLRSLRKRQITDESQDAASPFEYLISRALLIADQHPTSKTQ